MCLTPASQRRNNQTGEWVGPEGDVEKADYFTQDQSIKSNFCPYDTDTDLKKIVWRLLCGLSTSP